MGLAWETALLGPQQSGTCDTGTQHGFRYHSEEATLHATLGHQAQAAPGEPHACGVPKEQQATELTAESHPALLSALGTQTSAGPRDAWRGELPAAAEGSRRQVTRLALPSLPLEMAKGLFLPSSSLQP